MEMTELLRPSWPAGSGPQEAKTPQPATTGFAWVLAPGQERSVAGLQFGTSGSVPWGKSSVTAASLPRLSLSPLCLTCSTFLISHTYFSSAVGKVTCDSERLVARLWVLSWCSTNFWIRTLRGPGLILLGCPCAPDWFLYLTTILGPTLKPDSFCHRGSP